MGIIATSKARIRIPQQQQLAIGSTVDVYKNDGAGGAVSFSAPISPAPVEAWPNAGEGKIGCGLGPDGSGPDGLGTGGLGDGNGPCGYGPDGFGANFLAYETPELADATWKFAAVPIDSAGNPASPSTGTEIELTLAGTPKKPASVKAASWDDPSETVTLTLGLSPDDEG